MKEINKMKIIHRIFLLIGMMLLFSCNNINISKVNYKILDESEKKIVDSYKNNIEQIYNKKDDEIILIFQYNCFSGKKVKIGNIEEVEFKKEDESRYLQKISRIKKNSQNINVLMDGKTINIKFLKNYDYIRICYNEQKKKWYVIYYDFPKVIMAH